jgi:hypothetical protein
MVLLGTDVNKGKGKETQLDTLGEGKTRQRVNNIVIQRDSSVSLARYLALFLSNPLTDNSQTQTNLRTHSRTNSRTPAPPVPEPPTPKSTIPALPPSSLPSQPSSSTNLTSLVSLSMHVRQVEYAIYVLVLAIRFSCCPVLFRHLVSSSFVMCIFSSFIDAMGDALTSDV